MEMNRSKVSDIHYMDSTPISVCLNHKIYSHKVTKTVARISIVGMFRHFFYSVAAYMFYRNPVKFCVDKTAQLRPYEQLSCKSKCQVEAGVGTYM